MGNFPLDVPAVDLRADSAGRLAESLALLLSHGLALSHGDVPARGSANYRIVEKLENISLTCIAVSLSADSPGMEP